MSLPVNSVAGGGALTGIVTLTARAPLDGASVILSSGNPAAAPDSSVVVPFGQTNAQFRIQTKIVSSAQTVSITATYNATSRSALLTVNPQLGALKDLTLRPSTIIGGSGAIATGTVLLTAPAPTGGVTVAIAASSSLVQIPQTATVQSGQTSADFAIVAQSVTSPQSVPVSATYGGQTKSVSLTINPPSQPQPGPVAHLKVIAQGQTVQDQGTLNLSVVANTGVQAALDGSASTVLAGSIASWYWVVNGASLPCTSATCTATLTAATNTITLVVTDNTGKTATTSCLINLNFTSSTVTPSISILGTTPSPPVPSQSFNFTISGNNFDPALVQVLFNGPGCNPCIVVNSALTSKTATSLGGAMTLASGTFTVSVRNSATATPSNILTLNVVAPSAPPSIFNVSPNPVPGSTSIQTIAINGSGFVSGATATLIGQGQTMLIPANRTTFVSPNQMQISANVSNTASTWSVQVTNPNGSASNVFPFTVTAPVTQGSMIVTPLTFDLRFNAGAGPDSYGVSIRSASGAPMSGTITASTGIGGNWLTIGTATSYAWSAGETFAVTANPAGIAPGTYNGSLVITSPTATNSPVTIPVSMVILPALQITTTSLPNAVAGQAYNVQLQASGGTGYVWRLESGDLPTGLSLSSAGLISGVPTGPGSATVNISVQDGRFVFKTFSIAFQQAISLSFNGALGGYGSDYQYIVGRLYGSDPSLSFSASGGVPPYSYVATGMPPGLSIVKSTGLIIGTPTTSGSYSATITATDAQSRSGSLVFTLPVTLIPLGVASGNGSRPPTLPAGTVGVAYGQQYLQAGGGSQTGFTWALTQGSLPPGLSSNSSTGLFIITGTPTQAGTFTFTVQVTDSLRNTATATVSIIVNSGTPPTISSSIGLPLSFLGQPYSYPFTATGGSGGYSWSIIGSKPDPNLTLTSSGVLSGASTVPNYCMENPSGWNGSAYPSIYFTVRVTDSAGQSASRAFCLPSYYAQPQIISTSPASLTLDGAQRTIQVNGSNFRSNATLELASTTVPATYLNSGAMSFVVYPSQSGGFWSPMPPGGSQPQYPLGSIPIRIRQAYSAASNADVSFVVYNPPPVVNTVLPVDLGGTSPCKVNRSCRLVINGSGFTPNTNYLVKETNRPVFILNNPPTPQPWNSVTTEYFSVTSAGTYTIRVTNPSTASGSISIEKTFTVVN